MVIWKLQLDSTNTKELLKALDHRLQRATAGTAVTLTTTMLGPPKTLPVGTATHLASIAREAVANACKHAAATHIRIVCDTTNSHELILDVENDGNPMMPTVHTSPLSAGMGLRGMEARAQAMKGTLNFSSHDAGTRVRVRVPLA